MQNAGVKRVVRLRRRRARDRERAFLIEGYRELLRAVEAGLPLESVYHCPAFYLGSNEPALLDRACRECGAELVPTDDAVFAKLSYRDRPDGLLAVAPMPEWTLQRLPAPPADPLYVVATAIEKPGNLGTLLRTADAVGAAALIVCDPVTDLFNPNVVRASVGTLFTVPAAQAGAEATRRWLAGRPRMPSGYTATRFRWSWPQFAGRGTVVTRLGRPPSAATPTTTSPALRWSRPSLSLLWSWATSSSGWTRRGSASCGADARRVDPDAGPRARLGQRRHGGSRRCCSRRCASAAIVADSSGTRSGLQSSLIMSCGHRIGR